MRGVLYPSYIGPVVLIFIKEEGKREGTEKKKERGGQKPYFLLKTLNFP